jgi:hypothetical protein
MHSVLFAVTQKNITAKRRFDPFYKLGRHKKRGKITFKLIDKSVRFCGVRIVNEIMLSAENLGVTIVSDLFKNYRKQRNIVRQCKGLVLLKVFRKVIQKTWSHGNNKKIHLRQFERFIGFITFDQSAIIAK